jgi:hypothetical protein
MTQAAPTFVSSDNAALLADADPLRAHLQAQEAIIERNLQSYVEIGNALRRILDGRLYKRVGHWRTFEQYCAERWNFARQTAYDYLKGSKVAENVRMSVQAEPSLSQAVEMASLDPTRQREVVEAIFAEGKTFQDIVAFDLRQVVQDVKSGRSPVEAVHFFVAKNQLGARSDLDTVPDPPEHPISQAGDLWLLGDHRLLVGDATDHSDIRRLMAGEYADLVFTDPPYNVDYEGRTKDRLTIKGDRMSDAEYEDLLEKTFHSYALAVKSSASMYVCHASSWQTEFQNALEAAGFEIRTQIIWAKNQPGWGFARYKFQHEPIFYCNVAGETDAW